MSVYLKPRVWCSKMGRYRKKRMHVNDKSQKKKYRTKRRTKDLDQIQNDMMPPNTKKLIHQPVDPDLPGEGQHYCLHCARYFIDNEALHRHFKSKLHKRRLNALREPVYTQKEAEMAAGIGNYVLPPPPLDSGMKTLSTGLRTLDMGMRMGREMLELDIEVKSPNSDIKIIDKQLKSLEM